MIKNLELYLAIKFIKSKTNDTFIHITQIFAFIGIMLGVATLVIVTSVMNGFRLELMENITNFNGHMTIKSYENSITDYKQILENINSQHIVKHAAGIINEQGLIIGKDKYRGVIIIGIDYDILKKRENLEIIHGTISDNQIGVGSVMHKSIGAFIGNKIKVASSSVSDSLFGQIPKSKTFRIGFVFSTGLYNYDANVIFMPLPVAQKLLGYDNHSISDIQVFLKNPNETEFLQKKINSYLQKHNLYSYSWQNSNKALMNAVKIEKNVMTLILTLIILVAMFNVISSMVMLVKEKRKDIAVLRTMGFQKKSIIKIFILCGSFIGILGTTFGLGLGLIFIVNLNNIKKMLEYLLETQLFSGEIYFLLSLPYKIDPQELFVITSLSLLLSFIATIYPAIKAGNENPVNILRYE